MKFQVILEANIFHTDLSLDRTSHFLPLMVFLKLGHHHLTETVTKKNLGQRDKRNHIKLNGKFGKYHFLISKFIEKVQSLYL